MTEPQPYGGQINASPQTPSSEGVAELVEPEVFLLEASALAIVLQQSRKSSYGLGVENGRYDLYRGVSDFIVTFRRWPTNRGRKCNADYGTSS